jgi:integrase/recombinase XerC
VTRWLRAVERRVKPRDRALALIPFYAGLRLGEVIALDLDDIRLSARKGIVIVRAGKGGTYREVPVHPHLRPDLALWINDERPAWKGSAHTSALLLNHRGARLGARGADDILGAIADEAHPTDSEIYGGFPAHSGRTRSPHPDRRRGLGGDGGEPEGGWCDRGQKGWP